ncbi:MAG: glycosyltransferase family 2 protein, partial [Halobacteriaceae archaeon]
MGTEATIVLLTKNAGEQFREVLNAVFDQSGDFEVIVIDSGSTDATLSIAQEFPIRLIEIEPESFDHGGTRNLGAAKAKGDYICYLTQDATPCESWLENLLQPMKEDDTIAGVYSRQLPRDDATPMKKHFLKEFYPPCSETRSFSDEELIPLDDTFFSNVASGIRADVLEKIPFREDPIMSEDQIWAKRALEAGYKIRYESTSKVRHSHREGIVDIFKRFFDSGASLKYLNDGRTSPDVTTDG